MTDRELLKLAQDAAGKAYAPYSGVSAGAALECPGGRVFTGCTVENRAAGECTCAERTAVVKAVSEGVREFVRIAIYTPGRRYTLPCGSCRQLLTEFAPEIEILAQRTDGTYVSYPLRELLPRPYGS